MHFCLIVKCKNGSFWSLEKAEIYSDPIENCYIFVMSVKMMFVFCVMQYDARETRSTQHNTAGCGYSVWTRGDVSTQWGCRQPPGRCRSSLHVSCTADLLYAFCYWHHKTWRCDIIWFWQILTPFLQIQWIYGLLWMRIWAQLSFWEAYVLIIHCSSLLAMQK